LNRLHRVFVRGRIGIARKKGILNGKSFIEEDDHRRHLGGDVEEEQQKGRRIWRNVAQLAVLD
jgi:hypothetical protein